MKWFERSGGPGNRQGKCNCADDEICEKCAPSRPLESNVDIENE